MLCCAHVEVQYGMTCPFTLLPIYGEALKQLLATLVIAMNHGGKERFAKSSRTAQEYVLVTTVNEVGKILRLVYIKVFTLSNVAECLYSYRIFPCLCHDSNLKKHRRSSCAAKLLKKRRYGKDS